jgi:hypothetical protein
VETASESDRVKEEIEMEDDKEDNEEEEPASSHTPSVGTSDDLSQFDTPQSLKRPGFTWNYEVWIGTSKIRSWGGEVDEKARLNINDIINDGAIEMTQWLQKDTKYAAVSDTTGSIEAILTAKPQRPAFKHTIKHVSDWWSVERQMKTWFDAKSRDFFVQLKHKCGGITVAEMRSQGKNNVYP